MPLLKFSISDLKNPASASNFACSIAFLSIKVSIKSSFDFGLISPAFSKFL